MKYFAWLLGTAALGVVAAWSSDAGANCGMPVGYDVAVTDNAVTICPANHTGRACPDSSGMLRENATTDQVVKLEDYCSGSGYSGACYVDECVPPGTYRYGFATPYDCCSSCCGTAYFQEVTVESALPGNCARSEGNGAPAAFAGSIPWGDEQIICNYGGDNPDAETDDDDGGGCAVASHPANTVVAVNVLALLFGLGILAWRRAKHGS